jgi:hypothetical protein
MLDRWFPYIRFPIPLDGFLQLPKHAAYKWEYSDGEAILTARPKSAHALLALDRWTCEITDPFGRREEEIAFRPLVDEDWAEFPPLFAGAFHRVPPFSQLEDRAEEAAKDCLDRTRSGEDGPLVGEACHVATADGRIVGAMIVTLMSGGDPEEIDTWWRDPKPDADGLERREGRPHLTWAFVSPWYARHGVGTGLLGEAVPVLRSLGYRELASTFLLGNESSTLWHWRNGFRLLPGLDSLRAIRRSARRTTASPKTSDPQPPSDAGGTAPSD